MCNIRRSIGRRVKPLLAYLVSNVQRQLRTKPGKPICFVPFGHIRGRKPLWPIDIFTLAQECRRSLKLRGKPGAIDASALATVASTCVLNTDRWCRVLRRVPCPVTTSYCDGLSRRIRSETEKGHQLANVGITGVCAKSIVKMRGKALTEGIAKRVAEVCTVAGRAEACAKRLRTGEDWRTAQQPLLGDVLPRDGYTTKFIPYVLMGMGFQVNGVIESPDGGYFFVSVCFRLAVPN